MCLNEFDLTTDEIQAEIFEKASWRWPMYQVGIIIPVIFSVLEMGLNKILLRFRHAVLVLAVSLIYLAINFLGTLMYGKGNKSVYPSVLVWDKENLLDN